MKFISEILLVRVRRTPFSFKQLWLFSVVHVNVILLKPLNNLKQTNQPFKVGFYLALCSL